MKKQMLVGCVAAMVMMSGMAAQAQENQAVAGRKILDSARDAVIKIKLVVQQKMLVNGKEAQNSEETKEATGMVIDPSGLVVVSLSEVDPEKLMDSIMKNMAKGMKMETKFQVKDVKLILPDESEIDAAIVLRDKDLDLAFIRPTQKVAKPLAAVDLLKQAKPQVLDDVLVVKRLAKVANHEPAAVMCRIAAIVRKPRLFYIPAGEGALENMGTPVFAMDGNLVGLIVLRIMETPGGGGLSAMLGGAGGMGLTPVVLPAADIVEAARQAAEVKAGKAAVTGEPVTGK